jgi:hypothetical protein
VRFDQVPDDREAETETALPSGRRGFRLRNDSKTNGRKSCVMPWPPSVTEISTVVGSRRMRMRIAPPSDEN